MKWDGIVYIVGGTLTHPGLASLGLWSSHRDRSDVDSSGIRDVIWVGCLTLATCSYWAKWVVVSGWVFSFL